MKASNVKPAVYGTAEEIKALEFKMDAEVSYLKGTGVSVGKPLPGQLILKKNIDSTTNGFFRKMITGTFLPFVQIDYSDKNNLNYYSITLTDVFVTQLYFLSPECPTCIKLEHQVGLVFSTIKIEDKINNTTSTWDITKMTLN